MPTIPIQPLNVNKFWEKTPTPLKYLLIVAIIVACSYFLFSRKLDTAQIKELGRIEHGIDVTYELVDKFETYQSNQMQYNDEVKKDIANLYTLVTELNDNVNNKFDVIMKNYGKNNQNLIDQMVLLNESFIKVTKAYQPTAQPAQGNGRIIATPIEKPEK